MGAGFGDDAVPHPAGLASGLAPLSLDGSTLATSHSFPQVQLWDVATGAWRGTFPALASPLAFGGDHLLGTDETGFVQIHAASGGLIRSIPVPALPVQ